VKRSMVVPMLEVMDLCDTTRSSAKRVVTTVAPQALSLFNGDFINRQSGHLAARLRREVGDDPEKQIAYAYALALCRPPSVSESAAMAQYMKQEAERLIAEQATDPSNARLLALEQVCRVILNLNEFVYSD